MKHFAKILLILAILLALPAALLAAPVGKISFLEGTVDITAGSQVRDVKLGDMVSNGDILRAKRKAKAEVTFLDGNILRLAENSRVRIADYQMGVGKTSTMDLSRGKIQNIVSGLAKDARYEVHTPTAICGVRGTDFIAFFQNGVSGFVPKEGTIYGYNRTMPQDVKVVTAGQAIMVLSAKEPAKIQPATSTEVEKHVQETAPTEKKGGEEKKDEGKRDEGKREGETKTEPPLPPPPPPPPPPPAPNEGGALKDRVETAKDIDKQEKVVAREENKDTALLKEEEKIEEPVPVPVPSTTTTSMKSEVYFGPPGETTAAGTFLGELDKTTNTGSIATVLQYTKTSPGSGIYNTPQLEIGLTSGTMSDGSVFDSYLASIPGSWMGAMGGIYRNGTGAGLLLGYLTGTYDTGTGLLTAGGALTRTSTLLTIGEGATPLYNPDPITFPGLASISIGEDGTSYITSGGATLKANNAMVLANETGLLSAWAMDNLNGEGSIGYGNLSGQTTWKAKYGYNSNYYYSTVQKIAPLVLDPSGLPYFIVGDVTGTESDPSHVRLSGRGILYIDPYEMGTIDFEYWVNAGGYGGGTGILQAKPLAFVGYWGYDMGGNPYCLYANDLGYMNHIGDEWGLIGSWSAPWTGSTAIKGAGTYVMDATGYGSKPGYLWNSTVSSRGYADGSNDFYTSPLFADGDFYGFTAGAIGKLAKAADGIWQRSAKGALAAMYLKDGKAGVLTSFAPGSATGGLSGGFYPEATGDAGYWTIDGTLMATPMETRTTISEYSIEQTSFDAVAGYAAGSSSVRGSGNGENLHFTVYDPQREGSYSLPWGVYLLEISGYGDYGAYSYPNGGYGGNTFVSASGNPADLTGKEIKIGGTAYSGRTTYWLGDLINMIWAGAENGAGEMIGVASGHWLSEKDTGTFSGPFYGLYNEESPGSGTWSGQSVGTRSGAFLALNGQIYGSLKAYSAGYGGYGGSLDYIGGTNGLLGSTVNPLGGTANALLMGTYTTNTEIYREPALMYGSGWYLSGRMGIDTVTTTDDGAYNGYIVGVWNGGSIEKAYVLSIYNGPGGKAGYLYGSPTGRYFSEIGMWEASGNLAVAEQTGVTTELDVTASGNLFSGSFSGAAKAIGTGYAITADLVEGAMLGLKDQTTGWGIWNMGLGGTYSGTPAASFTAKIGGDINYSYSYGYGGSGYWLGDLNMTWGIAANRLSATLTKGLFMTDDVIGELATGPYGGILGSFSTPVDGAGIWQAAGVGTYMNVERLDFSGRGQIPLITFVPGDGYLYEQYIGSAATLFGGTDTALLTAPGTAVDATFLGTFTSTGVTPALFGYGNEGFFNLSALTGKRSGTTTGALRLAFAGVWDGGKLETTKALGLYVTADGKAGYLTGNLTGAYFTDLPSGTNTWLWQAESANLTAGTGHTTAATAETLNNYLVNGSLWNDRGSYGGIGGLGNASSFVSKTLQGVTVGLSDQNWGLWSLITGGGYEGILPASFTARVGGDYFTAGYGGVNGYWLGTLGVNAGSTANRLSASLINGRILTQYTLADLSTDRGGIVGTYDASTWQAIGVGSYENAETLAFGSRLLDGRIDKVVPETAATGASVPLGGAITAYNGGGYGIGSFNGILGGRGEAMALWTASSTAAPAQLVFLGSYAHDTAYQGEAYKGTLLFNASLAAYVDAGSGYGGSYFGTLAGLLPDTGSTAALEGNLYALYLAKTAGGENKAGILTGALASGEAYPEIGMWQADGVLYRTGVEVENTTGLSTANVIIGEAGVQATAGFYNPTGASVPAFGSGYGWTASISGINDLGIFSLRHNTLTLHENASTATTWETSGWADFGQYVMTGGGTYTDFGYWNASLANKSWNNGRLAGDLDGEFLTLKKWGIMAGKMLGSYDANGLWQATSQGYWLKSQDLAFSSTTPLKQYQLLYTPGETLPLSIPLVTTDYYSFTTNPFSGIMGGLNTRLWNEFVRTSDLKLRGNNYSLTANSERKPSLSLGQIVSFDPLKTLDPYTNSTTPIGGAYSGFFSLTADAANAVKGDLIALYQDSFLGVEGGYIGILYADALTGANHSAVGSWDAEGTLTVHEMTITETTPSPLLADPATFAQSVVTKEFVDSYAAGTVPAEVVSGGTVDMRISELRTQHIPDQKWGIWQMVAGGTATGGAPGNWFTSHQYLSSTGAPGYGTNYLSFNMGSAVDGISKGTVAGAQINFDGSTATDSKSYVVVLGGNVKGLFNPASTPANWMAIAQGGAMDAKAFMDKQSVMDDAARANLEKAMRIPSFEVGMGNLRGNNSNLYVNMDGIKFFRFQEEANPRIWATGNVYGTYGTDPSLGTKVTLGSSGGLAGLTQTFEVKQWNTGANNNWAADIYKGAGDIAGTLTRTETRTLPVGAASPIPITEMKGAAAGVITPGVINPAATAAGLTGSGSFTGAAAGTVR